MRSGCGGCNGGGARCGLCLRQATVFYCEMCVRRGDFVHSTTPFPDRFTDKKLKLMTVKSTCKYIEERCYELLESRTRKEHTISLIKHHKDRAELLRLAIQEKRECIKNYNSKLNSLKEYNEQLSAKLPVYKENVQAVYKYSVGKRKEIENRGNFLNSEQALLHALRMRRIQQLHNFIFPVKELNAQSQTEGHISCTERALAEALRPTKHSDSSSILVPLQIISATLPFDGDYSAYCNWVAVNKGNLGSTSNSANVEPMSQNPAYRLSAALAYSAQLIRIIASYLDVRLPCNVTYSDFCSSELEEKKFNRLVLKIQTCAAVLMKHIEVKKEKAIYALSEPPLHALLRLCPVKPKKDGICSEEDSNICDEIDDEESKESWWKKIDKDLLSLQTLTSDEEEPEPPEHLHWDSEAEVDPPSTSTNLRQGQGLMTNAAASIVSIWRVFTK